MYVYMHMLLLDATYINCEKDSTKMQLDCGTQKQKQNPFRRPREMDGLQKTLANLPSAAFYGAALLLITAAGALGYTVGARAPGTCKSC